LKGKKKIGTPASTSKSLYFGPDVQASILKFHREPIPENKEDIYIREIMPAFNKLVENLIFIYGFSKGFDSVGEIKFDCVCFLYENMHKFNPERGTKAFSYFNVVARNWLINNSKKRRKDDVRNVSIEDVSRLSSADKKTILHHSIAHSPDDILIDGERRQRILDALNSIEGGIHEPHELSVLAALRTIFENSDEIDLLSKRAVFLYIREISGVNHKQMSSAMSSIRKKYREVNARVGGIF
jgi:hypothetical protein